MNQRHVTLPLVAALVPVAALLVPAPLAAQITSGPGLSSGSGQGTGTGSSSAIMRNPSGSASGVGPGSATGIRGPESGSLSPYSRPAGTSTFPLRPGLRYYDGAGGFYPPRGSQGARFDTGVPLGPGVETSFPDDPVLIPLNTLLGEGDSTGPRTLSQIPLQLVKEAAAIAAPEERSLALDRIAGAAILSNQLSVAHQALNVAAQAAFQIRDPLVHDQRLIAIITALGNLSEAFLREGKVVDPAMAEPAAKDEAEPPALPQLDRNAVIRRADLEWRRSAYLAERITDPTYRSEMMFRVVDNQAFGSQTIVNEFPPDEAKSTAGPQGSSSEGSRALADRILMDSAAEALRIERPVWRDRALVAAAVCAASSKQFERGLQIARMIPQPEVRTDALVRLAEAQARRGEDGGRGATATYYEAARAVASIPLDDPRAVLTGVLIDNLISVGRFDDARATVGLYPDEPRRIIALGAIAESQGRRGLADSAQQWIAREVPPQYRLQLYRRLYAGEVSAIEQNRSRELSGNREQ